MTSEFLDVTEIQGERISREQLDRMCHRYHWASESCADRDVLEVACGAGQGLAILDNCAKSLVAGDYSPQVLANAAKTFPTFDLRVFGAEHLPFDDSSFDTIILFEAIYYVDHNKFFSEARRVLRPGGKLLIASANKDLYDFTPSPFAKRYLGAKELANELGCQGFSVELSGYLDITKVGLRQRLLRPVKAIASRFGLMPKTMRGKRILKKLFFGEMAEMPGDLASVPFEYHPPNSIPSLPDMRHKVLYCCASKA
ncbi:class I SAM-dependent methyltransferase [Tsuneonella flava]|uniref:Class I SAM-dependent methyltransferase n=1 Tax=Tsuneonella flava TaxID=2055955 RepID=A0ABX7KAP0_9SPHN|nr:class I SAM-dependent methyltransferase [Tsuneonella flava]QSB45032.1 class I SAM-dependent methyltransferase [Tsuneonella flava]